ncbi:sigma-70 family RNA polymerase sigma factor [Clostridium sp. AL.422]|uniref:sigma-70 family RNA polymerase sigma factor n=1 Tax=Clostridium TaxID=1485 RepID=UPI00293DDBB3|nr:MULTISPECIES: sigma-70 family RNA polymerase sigma factor [unclassified Clostridium]MDV4150318.1 sigma-70 family RNA polymerase sigma factor [Clostridium sp. AL.422]
MKNLIIRAKQGDKIALEEIIIKFKPLINNTAMSFYIYGYGDEDIKQIAILTIIKAVNKFDITLSDSFPSYVKEAVRNSIYKEIDKATKIYFKNKESKEIAKFIDIKEIMDENTNIQEDYIKKEGKRDLEAAISLLKEEERELLKAIYIERKTLRRYSEEKNIEYHKSRYIKDKAIKKLQDNLLNF